MEGLDGSSCDGPVEAAEALHGAIPVEVGTGMAGVSLCRGNRDVWNLLSRGAWN